MIEVFDSQSRLKLIAYLRKTMADNPTFGRPAIEEIMAGGRRGYLGDCDVCDPVRAESRAVIIDELFASVLAELFPEDGG